MMGAVAEVIKRFAEWSEPRDGVVDNPFRLACALETPASEAEISDAWMSEAVPSELLDLWLACRQARLFEDIDYGQWGLMLLSPSASAERTRLERKERPDDLRRDDVVIGEFLGDQDVLVLAPSEGGQSRVLVALPLDGRSDWYPVASGIANFLDEYLASRGDKYWEQRRA
jgi:hypothetical protein